jgi:limonene-1,2-epoxide hydrolase
MSDSPETAVREFFAAFPASDGDELISFFSEEAVYIDGPRGVHRGVEAIKNEFATQVAMVSSTTVDIRTLTMHRVTVMVEREERFEVGGRPIGHEVVGVFNVDVNGRITRWRDYYDLTSLVDRVVAAASPPTWSAHDTHHSRICDISCAPEVLVGANTSRCRI